jgi:hypothetical protein
MKDEGKTPEDNLPRPRELFPRYSQNHPAIVSFDALSNANGKKCVWHAAW